MRNINVILCGFLLAGAACMDLRPDRSDSPTKARAQSADRPAKRVRITERKPVETAAVSRNVRQPDVERTKLLKACPHDMDPRTFTSPKHILRMLECASRKNGVPMGIQFAIWTKESDAALYGDFGSARVMDQYAIRDCWKPGWSTRRPKGCQNDFVFKGEASDAERWARQKKPRSRLGNGTRQILALRKMAKAYGWKPWTIRGSKGTSTLGKRSNSFGGCIGPKQITPSEWIREESWQKYDPLNAYHAMILTGHRLKRHHDLWLKKHPGSSDRRAWRYAIERYIGGAGSKGAYGYYSRVINGERGKQAGWKRFSNMGWWHWTQMRKEEDFSKFAALSRKKYPNIQ